MPHDSGNPDRSFSADAMGEREAKELRDILKASEVANVFDDIVRTRVGELISVSMLNQSKQRE